MPSGSLNSLSSSLDQILARANGGSIRLGTVFEGMGDKGFGLLLAVLSLPSALPVPAAGYSTPFGILLALISLQMIALRPSPSLPAFANRRELKFATASRLFAAANGFLRRIEWLIHPRMRWVARPAGRCALGWLTLIMSCLMILPIPLTNTLPAMVIFAIGVGLSEEDGLLALFAFGAGLLAVAFYAFAVYILITAGLEGVTRLKDWIKSALGLA